MRRCELAEMLPESVAQLHKLHEVFMSSHIGVMAVEDTSAQKLDEFWGNSVGSWQIYGDCPEDKEKPLTARSLRLRAHRLTCVADDAGALLRSLGVAAKNTKGRKSLVDSVPGQDNLSISHLSSGWDIICLMDGHGVAGHWPATRSVRAMPYYLAGRSCSQMLRQWEVEAALNHAFDKAQSDLKFNALCERVDLQATGCTAVCAMWKAHSRSIWVATTGDSRAVLFAPGRGVIAETVDHKPTIEAEVDRIERSGGEVVRTEFDDGYVECRVNIAGTGYPGLSMTRSLGDLVMKDVGVIATPQVVKWDMVPGALLLIASDGIWEFLSTEEVVQVVLDALARMESFDTIVSELVETARMAWRSHEGTYCDDISVVLLSPERMRSAVAKASPDNNRPCFRGVCRSLRRAGCAVS